jgi:hypothetical protein
MGLRIPLPAKEHPVTELGKKLLNANNLQDVIAVRDALTQAIYEAHPGLESRPAPFAVGDWVTTTTAHGLMKNEYRVSAVKGWNGNRFIFDTDATRTKQVPAYEHHCVDWAHWNTPGTYFHFTVVPPCPHRVVDRTTTTSVLMTCVACKEVL